MMGKMALWVCIFTLVAGSSGFAQQSAAKGESGKFRAIFTFAGAGGGFVLGLGGGLAAFDDAINSSRKVWMTALLAAAGGGVGGYFLGRSLDKHRAQTSWMYKPDPLDLSLVRYRLSSGAPSAVTFQRATEK